MKTANIHGWLKRSLWSLALLGVLLISFHRPVLRTIVDQAGRYYAEKSGYKLDWQIRGSITSDLSVSNLSLIGPQDGTIRLLHVNRASVQINLWRLLTRGPVQGIQSIFVADATIEADTRKSPKSESRNGGTSIPELWLQRLDLQNINVRIHTIDGAYVLQGFTLLLDESKAGKVQIAELVLPGSKARFVEVSGKSEIRERRLVLSDLVITPDVTISRLIMDFRHLKMDSLPFEAVVRSGQATLESSGRIDSLTNGPSIDLTLKVNQMAHSELDRWVALPDEFSWVIDSAIGHVKGALDEPLKLRADLTLAASEIRAKTMHFQRLVTRLRMGEGRVEIDSLELQMNEQNRASFTGDVALNNRHHVNLAWKSEIGNFDSMALPAVIKEAQVGAQKVESQGTVDLDVADVMEGEFGDISGAGTVEVTDLHWQQRRIERASLQFKLDEGRAQISNLELRINDRNHLAITGDIGLIDRHAFGIQWQLELKDFAALAPWIALKDFPLPSSGAVTSNGKLSGTVADIREKKYHQLEGNTVGRLQSIVWQEATLEEVVWDAAYLDGRIDVQKLDVRFNERNALAAVGHATLGGAGEFAAEVSGNLGKLADLSGWMKLAKQPPITGGRASLSWKGNGRIAEGKIKGAGSLNVTDLTIKNRTDVFSLALETDHSGRRAEIKKFQASLGKLRAEASMVISDTDLKIPLLVLSSEDTRLINGSAELPLALDQRPRPTLPLDRSRPMKVHLQIAKMPVQNLIAVMGKKSPITGTASVDLNLSGTPSDLSGRVSATLSEAQYVTMNGRLSPALIKVDAALSEGVLTVKSSAQQKPLQTLTMDAVLPLDVGKTIENPNTLLDAPLTANLILPSSNLALLQRFVPSLAAISGNASVNANITGTLRKPEWKGSVLANAEIATIRDSDVDIRNVKARCTFIGQRLVFDDVSLMVSGGGLRVGGTMHLTQLTDPKLDLVLSADQALLYRNDTMSLRANGNLTCTGPMATAEVAGRVELVRGRVFKEIEFLPLSFPDQLPPKPAQVRSASKPPSAPTFFANWNLDVDIVTGDPIRLLGNVLNGFAVADLHLSGTGALPVLEGKISQQGARVKLPFSRLDLSRGDILFTKDRPFDPLLDLQGDSMVGGTHVTVYATGPAAKPTLRFASSPPLSEPEIATLLATGTSAGDPQAASGVAANRAAFLVLSKAYRKLFGKRTTNILSDFDEDGRTSFNFNPLSSQTSSSNFSTSYEFSPNWRAEVGLGERGFRGMLSYLIRIR